MFRGSEAKGFRRSLIGGFFNPGPLFFNTVCGLLLGMLKSLADRFLTRSVSAALQLDSAVAVAVPGLRDCGLVGGLTTFLCLA